MKCCGYERETKFCCQCGKSLKWNPKKIMLSYYRGRAGDLEQQLENQTEWRGGVKGKPRMQTINRIDMYKTCIKWLEKQAQ